MVSHGAVSLWMHSYRLVVLLARRKVMLLVVWPVDWNCCNPTQLCALFGQFKGVSRQTRWVALHRK